MHPLNGISYPTDPHLIAGEKGDLQKIDMHELLQLLEKPIVTPALQPFSAKLILIRVGMGVAVKFMGNDIQFIPGRENSHGD